MHACNHKNIAQKMGSFVNQASFSRVYAVRLPGAFVTLCTNFRVCLFVFFLFVCFLFCFFNCTVQMLLEDFFKLKVRNKF